MTNFIADNYLGVKITVTISGLPCTITGEVVKSTCDNLVTLKLSNGSEVTINAELIAFIL